MTMMSEIFLKKLRSSLSFHNFRFLPFIDGWIAFLSRCSWLWRVLDGNARCNQPIRRRSIEIPRQFPHRCFTLNAVDGAAKLHDVVGAVGGHGVLRRPTPGVISLIHDLGEVRARPFISDRLLPHVLFLPIPVTGHIIPILVEPRRIRLPLAVLPFMFAKEPCEPAGRVEVGHVAHQTIQPISVGMSFTKAMLVLPHDGLAPQQHFNVIAEACTISSVIISNSRAIWMRR